MGNFFPRNGSLSNSIVVWSIYHFCAALTKNIAMRLRLLIFISFRCLLPIKRAARKPWLETIAINFLRTFWHLQTFSSNASILELKASIGITFWSTREDCGINFAKKNIRKLLFLVFCPNAVKELSFYVVSQYSCPRKYVFFCPEPPPISVLRTQFSCLVVV